MKNSKGFVEEGSYTRVHFLKFIFKQLRHSVVRFFNIIITVSEEEAEICFPETFSLSQLWFEREKPHHFPSG